MNTDSTFIVLAGLVDKLQPLMLLALRLYVPSIFFRASIIKISDWRATLALFHDEYKVPLLPADLAAFVGTFGELRFPVLIMLGPMGRFGAAGLFVVNHGGGLYPQLCLDCPARIEAHFYWGSIPLALTIFGPGRRSLDPLILQRTGLRPSIAV